MGYNRSLKPRGENLSSFATLRVLADVCDLVRIAIEYRKEQMSGLAWEIVPSQDGDKTDYSKEIAEIKAFFKKPDRPKTWYDWIGVALEEVLVVDALTIYKRRTKGGGLYGLECIDGSTIKPLVDDRGRTPVPPLKAYQQVVYGATMGEYTTEEVIYKPKNQRTWTVYGFSPVEYVLMTVNLALRRQKFFLDYFTDGTLPDAGLYSLPETWTPQQIEEFQKYWDTVNDPNIDPEVAHKLRFVPNGDYHSTKELKFDPQVEEWLSRVVAAAFGVNPQILVKQQNRSTAEVQEEIQDDSGLKPLMMYVSDIMNDVIAEDMLKPHLKFQFITKKKKNERDEAVKNVNYVRSGLRGVDELRAEDGKEPLGIPPYILMGKTPWFITPETVKAQIEAQIRSSEMSGKPIEAIDPEDPDNPTEEEPIEDETGKKTKKTSKKDDTETPAEELKGYQKFVENRVLKKKYKQRPFVPVSLPQTLVKNIEDKLCKVNDQDDVKKLFKWADNTLMKVSQHITTEQSKINKKIDFKIQNISEDFMEWLDDWSADHEMDLESLLDDVGKYEFVGVTAWSDLDSNFSKLFKDGWESGLASLNAMVTETIEIELTPSVVKAWAEEYTAKLIKTLDETTKVMVKDSLIESFGQDLTWEEIKGKLQSEYALSPYRAEVIARTESAAAYNTGGVKAWKESGIVVAVEVYDGDGCEACILVQGAIWTLDEAYARPYEHPNCVREFFPILSEDIGV
jgi:hypothetical protein